MADRSGQVEDKVNVSRERVGDILHRKRLSSLSEEELTALRTAFSPCTGNLGLRGSPASRECAVIAAASERQLEAAALAG